MNKMLSILAFLLIGTFVLLNVGCSQSSGSGDDEGDAADFNPADFQTTVDNPYFVLAPGTEKTFEGNEEGDELLVYTSVLSETKKVAGVVCSILREEEYKNGELVEISWNWFAQEIVTGNVYYFGEDVDEYEDGQVSGHPGAWKVGDNADAPGMIFPGDPQIGDIFSPEAAPGEAEEEAEIIETGLDYTTPFGDFNDVIRVEEHGLLDDSVGWKYYAPGVGMIAEEYEEGDMPLTEMQ